ncbi:bacterial bifunctional deaminase-reductase [Backusella circina FSU 941]|nr:bacterial bifunctional deaminase-reductase [Backusella circina FSU 941]
MEKIFKKAKDFLDPLYQAVSQHNDRPFVTLTFAQSLDGKISKTGQQVIISGKESMAMTHRLRVLHDGIMVGIGTALIDNPQLNGRHMAPEELSKVEQPQPIVLDPSLDLPLDCKLIKNYQNSIGKQVWLVTRKCSSNHAKKEALEKAGAKILEVDHEEGRIPLYKVFSILREDGIKTLMVEGGAKIIQSCLTSKLCDQLIITVAPLFIGADGVSETGNEGALEFPSLTNVKYEVMGNDVVMAAEII